MRAGNTANSLKPKQVEESVPDTQEVEPIVEVAEVAPVIESVEVEESLDIDVNAHLSSLYESIDELMERVASLEARIELHNRRSSHKI